MIHSTCSSRINTAIFFVTILATISTFAILNEADAQSLNLDSGFNAGVTAAPSGVHVSKVQTDGKILVGGKYNFVNGEAHSWVARLNADGTRDAAFNVAGAGPNGHIFDIVFLADGKILIGGKFSSYNGFPIAGIVRLNADGTLDASFNLGGSGTSGTVQTIALQPDGKIIFSGSLILSYNGIDRFSVVRLNADGSLDDSFISPFMPGTFVEEVDVLPDGKVLACGSFSVGTGPIVRLNNDGTIDETFTPNGPGADSSIFAMEPLADGKILIGGTFLRYNGIPRRRIARLNADGTLDESFVPPIIGQEDDNSVVEYFAVQPNGQILVAGTFNPTGGFSSSLIRLNADGTQDPEFQVSTDYNGYHVTRQDDGKIILTGFFSRLSTGETRIGVARFDPDGQVDPSFNVSLSVKASVTAMTRQPDGKLLVGGYFSRANQTISHRLARFHDDGTVDGSFSVGLGPINNFELPVSAIAVQPDGKILVGGKFVQFGTSPKRELARLNADGTVDDTFTFTPLFVGLNGIQDIAVLPDGKILITGESLRLTVLGASRFLLRLNSDGSLDTSFIVNSLGNVTGTRGYRILEQADGKIIVCGGYTGLGANPSGNIARFNSDGSKDSSFTPVTGPGLPQLSDAALQPDGKIVVVGAAPFTTTSRQTARLNANGTIDSGFNVGAGANAPVYSVAVLPDGKIVIGGAFTTFNGQQRGRFARLNSDGSLDTGVVSGMDTLSNNAYSGVTSLLSDPAGRIYAGGEFSSYNGVQRNSLVRLARRSGSFDYDGDSRSDISVFRPSTGDWYLQQSTAGFYGQNFGSAEDRIAPADYNGDGKTDIAVYRPSTGIWYVTNSSNGTVTYHVFGIAEDLPTPADYDGDGKADISVFRPSTGTWYRINSVDGSFTAVQFGASEDKPTIGDFDGDGKADIAVFRPSTGAWYQTWSSNGFLFGEQFGIAADRITPADYDGDGKTDIAIYRPSEGLWYIKNSATTTYVPYVFGLAVDIPTPGEFDGDGKADIAVFRPSDGTWYIVNSSNSSFTILQFGQNFDKPTQSAFNN